MYRSYGFNYRKKHKGETGCIRIRAKKEQRIRKEDLFFGRPQNGFFVRLTCVCRQETAVREPEYLRFPRNAPFTPERSG